MKKYLIKREIEGASQIPQEKLSQIGEGSETVLVKMRSEGKEIEQEHSYIVGDNVFVYIMPKAKTLYWNTLKELVCLQMKL